MKYSKNYARDQNAKWNIQEQGMGGQLQNHYSIKPSSPPPLFETPDDWSWTLKWKSKILKVKVVVCWTECGPLRESESYLARLRMWPVMFKLPLLLLLPLLLPQAAVKGLTLEGSSTSYAQVPVKKTSYPQVPKQLNGKSLFFHPVQEMVHWVQFFPRNGV